jgi:hypothetical protein
MLLSRASLVVAWLLILWGGYEAAQLPRLAARFAATGDPAGLGLAISGLTYLVLPVAATLLLAAGLARREQQRAVSIAITLGAALVLFNVLVDILDDPRGFTAVPPGGLAIGALPSVALAALLAISVPRLVGVAGSTRHETAAVR